MKAFVVAKQHLLGEPHNRPWCAELFQEICRAKDCASRPG